MPELSNIARHLPLMAKVQPGACAIKIPRGRTRVGDIDYLSLSFAELEEEAAAWQKRLLVAGVQRGDRTLVMVRPGLPLIASVFALFALGAVPIVIDPGIGLRHFLSCVRRSHPRVLLGVPLALGVSWFARKSFASVKVRVGASARLTARLTGDAIRRGGSLQLAQTGVNELAAILFTSGSTGAPKGVCYEHGMFEAQVASIRSLYDIRPGERDLPLLPIFALFNPALGMTTVVPEIDPGKPAAVDPARIVQAIRQEGITNSFGSPTLWRIIADHCIARGIQLPSLKRVLCAGAPVPASLWEDSGRILPNGAMHSPYGATEALPVASVSSAELDGASLAGALVGRPAPGMELRVIAIDENPIADLSGARMMPAGEIGEIIVKGSVVTRSYDELPEATAAAKIRDGAEFWHRMGDTGFVDAEGRLWFCGRKAERVVTEEEILFTEPVERIFRGHPRARRCALIGLGPRDRQMPALVVETRIRSSQEARILARELRLLAQQQTQTQHIKVFYFNPRFPVDVRHNAKIHRLALARWAHSAKGFRSNPKR